MLTSIEGKSVIVTGASKGIGKGIAGVFASKGAKVLVVARNADAGNQAVAEFEAAGGTAAFCQDDVTSWESMQAMAQTAVDTHGGLDILCANAGIFPNVQLTEMSSEDWDEVLAALPNGCSKPAVALDAILKMKAGDVSVPQKLKSILDKAIALAEG